MYPNSLLNNNLEIFPIFGNQSIGKPIALDYSVEEFQKIDPRNMNAMNQYNEKLLREQNATWGFGGYLEDRSYILTGTHIQKEGRTFHLGIDVLFKEGTNLYNPLDGVVHERGYESGDGNYGGYIIIRYGDGADTFYALYGHLSYDFITMKDIIPQGELFAKLGGATENGNWFPHLHLQVFTGKDLEIWKSKGYCTLSDISRMRYFCPDPSFLLRY